MYNPFKDKFKDKRARIIQICLAYMVLIILLTTDILHLPVVLTIVLALGDVAALFIVYRTNRDLRWLSPGLMRFLLIFTPLDMIGFVLVQLFR